MTSLAPLAPLLLTAGIVLGGNGVQGTLIALRAADEGFPQLIIGLLGTSYFFGFLLGCIYAPRLIRLVGHIRVFAAFTSLSVICCLMLIMVIEPWMWIILRCASGVLFSGLFTVIESWLNEASENADRGRVLSIYRLIDLGSVTGAQFLLPVFGIAGPALFVVIAMVLAISTVPIALADKSNPDPPESFRFDLKQVWVISPVACIGCLTIGLTNSAFRLVGPLFASDAGLSVTAVAVFMSAGIIGGAVFQFPLGWLSDKTDRRWLLICATLGAVAAGVLMTIVFNGGAVWLYVGVFLFGGFSLPLYSLSAAHANDRAQKGQYVLLAAGLSFFFALGATIGPLIAAGVMQQFGTAAFFNYTSTIHASLIVIIVWRMLAREGINMAGKSRFVALLRTSPVFFKLARRNKRQ